MIHIHTIPMICAQYDGVLYTLLLCSVLLCTLYEVDGICACVVPVSRWCVLDSVAMNELKNIRMIAHTLSIVIG